MRFNNHSNLLGKHAFLSPSSYHWINYTDEHLETRFKTAMAAMRGTELHEYAHTAIRLGIKQAANKSTLSMYINDAIGFRLTPEQTLVYSENCFGTADTIGFRRNTLRIHDLKNGKVPAHIEQLEVYAALFCLEYRMKPFEINILLRIYQNDAVEEYATDKDAVTHIMAKIISFDKRLKELKEEAMS